MPIDPSQFTPSLQWPTSPESNGIISPMVSGNYVTPEQAQQMRLYADALSKHAMKMPVKNGWQGLGQVANSVMGGLLGNYSDNLQRQLVTEGTNLGKPYYEQLNSINGGSSPTGVEDKISDATSPSDSPSATPPTDSTKAAPVLTAVNEGDPISQLKENLANKIESGGNYAALGPTVTHKDGSTDRAYGKFQVMGSNIPSWTKEILGVSMTPEEFVKSPNAQEKVATAKLGQYYQQTGSLQDAASMWFTGHPLAEGANKTDQNGMTGARYAQIATGGIHPPVQMADADGSQPQTASAYAPTPEKKGISWDDVQKVNDEGDKGFADGSTAARAAAYAQNGGAPALAAIQASAPPANSPPVPPAAPVNAPNPYQLAALRKQGLTPAMMARMMADPNTPESVKAGLNELVKPQIIPGPFGTSGVGSMNGILNGVAPRPFSNTGQMIDVDLPGGLKGKVNIQYDPRTGKYETKFMMPGSSGSFGPSPATSAPPPPGVPSARPVPGVPSARPVQTPKGAPTPPVEDEDTPIAPPMMPGTPGGPNANDPNAWTKYSTELDGFKKRQEDQAKRDTDAYAESSLKMKSTQDMLNNLNVYKATLADLKAHGGEQYLGALEPRSKELLSLANSLGFAPKSLKDALANLEEMEKTSGQMIISKLGNTPGLSGHSTDSLRGAIQNMTPNPQISSGGNHGVIDTLEKNTQLDNMYFTKRQSFMDAHGQSLVDHATGKNFDKEWAKAIRGKGSNDPILADVKPQILSEIPMEPPRKDDKTGDLIMKVPSTHERGYALIRVKPNGR